MTSSRNRSARHYTISVTLALWLCWLPPHAVAQCDSGTPSTGNGPLASEPIAGPDVKGTTEPINSSPATGPGQNEIVRETEPAQKLSLADEFYANDRLRQVDDLTQAIAKKELELIKHNTYFRLETTDQSRIKPWRTFLYNLAGSGVAHAGITTIAAERWRTWQRPATANRNTLKAGPILLLTSHSIMTGAILAESSLDFLKDWQSKRGGRDAKSTKKRIIALRAEVDRLLIDLDSAIQAGGLSPGQREIARAEQRVLKDIRDLGLLQFAQFYTRASKRRWVRDVGYVNQLAAATTGGFIGSLCGLLAVADRKPRLAGPAGIGFTLSGAHIVIGPVLGRGVSILAGKRASKKINNEIGQLSTKSVEVLNASLKALKQAAQAAPPSESKMLLANRLKAYEAEKEIFEAQSKMNMAEKKKADREFIERFIFNAGVGGTKMGWGIQLANAGFGFHPRPAPPVVRIPVRMGGTTVQARVPPPRGATNLFARRVAQGATTYIPGTGLWILDTLQARTRGEMDIYSLGTQMALPHQKLKSRLSRIESLEATLAGGNGNP